jgi:hypothetical protein
MDEQTLQAIRILVKPHKPRGLFQGIWKASKSTAQGFLLGTTSMFTFPLVTTMMMALGNNNNVHASSSSILVSTLLGALFGIGAIAYGIWNGVHHCVWGLVQFPKALQSRWRGWVWNPQTENWESYSLEQDYHYASSVLLVLEEEEASFSSFERRRRDGLYYYQLLQVPSTASRSQIRRAYHQAAKRWHPDKNPGTTTAAAGAVEDFLVLSKAYHTLSDDTARANYDTSAGAGGGGLTTSSGDVPPMIMDPRIFFAILLDSYDALLPYTGELPMVHFASAFFRSGFLSLDTDDDIDIDINDMAVGSMMESMIQSLADSKLLAHKRQVDIAMRLRDTLEPLVSGESTEQDFRLWAAREARRIFCGGAIGARQQALVGLAMKDAAERQHGGLFWGRILRWPWGGGRKTARRIRIKCQLLGTSFRLLKHFSTSTSSQSSSSFNKEKDDEGCCQTILTRFLRLVQGLNELDIASTIDGAAWKLLHDSGVSRNERSLRARALEILGEEFLKVSVSVTSRSRHQGSDVEDDLDLDRLSIAEYLAYESSSSKVRE